MNEFRRIFNIFFNPPEAFQDIAQRPRWWAPVVIVSLLSLTLIYCYGQRVGWDRVVRQSIESSSRTQNMSQAQKDQAIQVGARVAGVAGYAGAISPLLIAVGEGAIFLFIFNLIGRARIRFHQAAAVTAYSYLTQAISIPISIAMLYLKSPDEFDIRNPNAFNVGYFLPHDIPQALMSVASSIDLFSFWTLGLLACGFAICAKVRFSKALWGVVVPWLIYVAVKTMWTAAFA